MIRKAALTRAFNPSRGGSLRERRLSSFCKNLRPMTSDMPTDGIDLRKGGGLSVVKVILNRCIQIIPTLLVVVTLAFFLTRMLPGDPAVAILGPEAKAEEIEILRQNMGLDKSIPEQYINYITGICRGDFGVSYSYHQPVLSLIISRIPNTLKLTMTSLIISLMLGIGAGVLAATKQNTIVDYVISVLALLGVSMPAFWLGLMLILQFSVKMNLFPVMGMGSMDKGLWDVISHMILPGFVLAVIPMGTFARTTRSSMIEVLSSDSIRCLRARGIRESKVIWVHALKNALPPIVTVFGLQLAGTFGGAIVTEGIFSWPGMGTVINTAINNRDYSLIQGAVVFIAIAFVFCNMLVDIIYMLLNPKVDFANGGH